MLYLRLGLAAIRTQFDLAFLFGAFRLGKGLALNLWETLLGMGDMGGEIQWGWVKGLGLVGDTVSANSRFCMSKNFFSWLTDL
eukprot:1085302-Amorphochlora_amoeboformis.AAC.1